MKNSMLCFATLIFSSSILFGQTNILDAVPASEPISSEARSLIKKSINESKSAAVEKKKEDKSEFSYNCKTWQKVSSIKEGDAKSVDHPTFYRNFIDTVKPHSNEVGLFDMKNQKLTAIVNSEFWSFAVIRSGFVILTPTKIMYQPLLTQKLGNDLVGFLGGTAITAANADVINGITFSLRDSKLAMLRALKDSATKKTIVLMCEAAYGCKFKGADEKEATIVKRGSADHIELQKSNVFSEQVVRSVDDRCKILRDGAFQRFVAEHISEVEKTCPNVKGANNKKTDFKSFETACRDWEKTIKPIFISLR